MSVKFQLSSSNSFGYMREFQIYTVGHCAPHTTPSGNVITSKKYLALI